MTMEDSSKEASSPEVAELERALESAAIPADFASRAAQLAAAEAAAEEPAVISSAAAAAAAAQEYSSSVAEWSASTPDVSALLAGTRRLLRL